MKEIILAILLTWLSLTIAVFVVVMARGHRNREEARWLKLHPGMKLHRKPFR